MNFGVSSIFSFRPHVEHLVYLARLLEDAGHNVMGFDCLSAASSCYPRNLREGGRLLECSKCIAGGIRSYGIPVSESVRPELARPLSADRLSALSISSAATVFRTEPASDLLAPEVVELQKRLAPNIEMVYGSALEWIEKSALDAVIFFNGRMDLTAGLRAACEDSGIPFISTERAWLGHGIRMIPNGNCLDIAPVSDLCKEYVDKPLLEHQARLAGKIAAGRFMRTNKLEWRLYNENEARAIWPAGDKGRRLLIVPSSRNEFEGHPECMCAWDDYTNAMQKVVERLGIAPSNVVLRCHPNWAETIGRRSGEKSENHYTRWAKRLGYHVVPSTDRRSTYDLIEQSDIVLVNGSSSGVEAGLRGKNVVSVGHCPYEAAGFSIQIHGPDQFGRLDDIDTLSKEEIVRQTLRYVYLQARRLPQFCDFVRALSTTSTRYFAGGDAGRIEDMIRTRRISADDPAHDVSTNSENAVIEKVLAADWSSLSAFSEPEEVGREVKVARRSGLRWIDTLRERLPRGDR